MKELKSVRYIVAPCSLPLNYPKPFSQLIHVK